LSFTKLSAYISLSVSVKKAFCKGAYAHDAVLFHAY